MTERRDADIHAVPGEALAEMPPPTYRFEPDLIAPRLALIGVLLSVGLGVAGCVIGTGVYWGYAFLAGAASFVAAVIAVQQPRSSRLLARFAEWVLPIRPPDA